MYLLSAHLATERRSRPMDRCFFCMKPSEADGSTYHNPNCLGRENSTLNNLQVHDLEVRIRQLESLVDRFMRVPIQDDAHDKTWNDAFAADIPRTTTPDAKGKG